jgi:hypothetical protein
VNIETKHNGIKKRLYSSIFFLHIFCISLDLQAIVVFKFNSNRDQKARHFFVNFAIRLVAKYENNHLLILDVVHT